MENGNMLYRNIGQFTSLNGVYRSNILQTEERIRDILTMYHHSLHGNVRLISELNLKNNKHLLSMYLSRARNFSEATLMSSNRFS